MEPEKLAIVGVTLTIVTLGLLIGVSFLTFPAGDGAEDDPLTRYTLNRDLLDLGLEAPSDWTFEMSDGTTLVLNDLRGQIVLIDLMATWCSTCVLQNSILESVHENLAGTAVVISLSVDDTETTQLLAKYKSDNGLPWDHGLDSGDSFDSYFNIVSIPTLVLIDADGIFRYQHVGVWSEASITSIIASIL